MEQLEKVMFKNKMSANMVIGNKYDDKTQSIENMSNKITVNDELSADFVLGLFVNFYSENPRSFFYVVLRNQPDVNNKDDMEIALLPVFTGEVEAEKDYGKRSFQHMVNFDAFKFPKEGKYVFELYCVDADNSPDYTKMEFLDAYKQFAQGDNLVDAFEVDVKKEANS